MNSSNRFVIIGVIDVNLFFYILKHNLDSKDKENYVYNSHLRANRLTNVTNWFTVI